MFPLLQKGFVSQRAFLNLFSDSLSEAYILQRSFGFIGTLVSYAAGFLPRLIMGDRLNSFSGMRCLFLSNCVIHRSSIAHFKVLLKHIPLVIGKMTVRD